MKNSKKEIVSWKNGQFYVLKIWREGLRPKNAHISPRARGFKIRAASQI
jgi:hypothetical protein